MENTNQVGVKEKPGRDTATRDTKVAENKLKYIGESSRHQTPEADEMGFSGFIQGFLYGDSLNVEQCQYKGYYNKERIPHCENSSIVL